MRTEIYTTYAPDTDITFILEDVWNGEELVSTEVKGFYFGEPNDDDTQNFYGGLKAEF